MENIFHANGNDKKVGLAILISDKTDFKTESKAKDIKGHYIMKKGSIKKMILHSLIYMHSKHEHLNIQSKY